MTIGTPEPNRGIYLLTKIVVGILIGIPVFYGIVWVVGETVEHFTH